MPIAAREKGLKSDFGIIIFSDISVKRIFHELSRVISSRRGEYYFRDGVISLQIVVHCSMTTVPNAKLKLFIGYLSRARFRYRIPSDSIENNYYLHINLKYPFFIMTTRPDNRSFNVAIIHDITFARNKRNITFRYYK